MNPEALVRVSELAVHFPVRRGIGGPKTVVRAVQQVSVISRVTTYGSQLALGRRSSR